jgi:hypothetical protein
MTLWRMNFYGLVYLKTPCYRAFHITFLLISNLPNLQLNQSPFHSISKMVKVLENRVVDLDILPGTKEEQEAAAKAKYVILFRPHAMDI